MRFRDFFLLFCVIGSAAFVGVCGWSAFQGTLFESKEINRDDARRESTSLLSEHSWVEFQIGYGASKFRLLTNAALDSIDAPDHDLSNPRLGWRYAIEYELLDVDRNLIHKSEYHFRSEVRQLRDADSDQVIYPLFFGKSSLVATQTRAMQIAVDRHGDQRVAIVRARLLSTDPQISEVVVRTIALIERQDYRERKTWNRMSHQRREDISKYCVYGHELLTVAERDSLLRWRWIRCPLLGESEQRFLFFIGDEDDQEIRDEQIPFGLYTDPETLATIPVPEGKGRVRLELTRLESNPNPELVTIRWNGLALEDHSSVEHPIHDETSTFEIDVDGGLLEIESPTRLVVRALWQPVDELARQTATDWESYGQNLLNEAADEFEITPRQSSIRTFLSDTQSVEYTISHYRDQPTPLRVQVRYPLGVQFNNQPSGTTAKAHWKLEAIDGSIIDSGILETSQQPSAYDSLTSCGMRDLVSDPTEYYFSIPADVAKFRIHAEDCRLLVNAYVRPSNLQRTIRVPEDYHPFNRNQSLNRTWFGLNPLDHLTRIRDNRSFLINTQTRPSIVDEDILRGDYEWFRFTPDGQWIGRQMLIPQLAESELRVREQAMAASYFELTPGKPQHFRPFEFNQGINHEKPRLVYAGEQPPGLFSILVDGHNLIQTRLMNRRGELDLSELSFPVTGQIEIRTENPARFFLRGFEVESADQFLKRTAQRLQKGQLEFQYTKYTRQAELLTVRLYRGPSASQRCKLRVTIEIPELGQQEFEQPRTSWTVTDRIYDLRALTETPSLVLDNNGQADTGHGCFIKLGEELPPGDYTIKVQSEDGASDGLVLLYRTVAGKFPVREISVGRKAVQP